MNQRDIIIRDYAERGAYDNLQYIKEIIKRLYELSMFVNTQMYEGRDSIEKENNNEHVMFPVDTQIKLNGDLKKFLSEAEDFLDRYPTRKLGNGKL